MKGPGFVRYLGQELMVNNDFAIWLYIFFLFEKSFSVYVIPAYYSLLALFSIGDIINDTKKFFFFY